MNGAARFLTMLVGLTAWPVMAPASATAQGTAETMAGQILDATGVKGGLVVHVNCGNGELTAALRAADSYLVQGLDRDPADVAAAREHIRVRGLYGSVSVQRWSGKGLPFIENVVNLIVVQRGPKVSKKELLRVLAPGGTAYVEQDKGWRKIIKPRPQQIDEWTHYLHDPGNNAVAHDSVVGPPRRMQWRAAPIWTRNHHTLASVSSVVSAGGRLFYIVDQATAATMKVPGQWSLVARDAFNGVLLWKRAIPSWALETRKFRSGPVQLQRLLVACGGRVYATLGMNEPVSAIDAATGTTIAVYERTKGTEEIIVSGNTLLAVVGSPVAEQAAIDPKWHSGGAFKSSKSIVAISTESGRVLWTWRGGESGGLMPLTLAATDKRVFFQAGNGVTCLELKSGRPLWRTDAGPADGTAANRSPATQKKARSGRPKAQSSGRGTGWSTATLVVDGDRVFWADGNTLRVLSAEDGRELWQCPCKAGFRSPVDVFVADGLVWIGPDYTIGRDPASGRQVRRLVRRLIDPAELRTAGHHHRCYREKATDRFIIGGYRGMEFFDLDDRQHSRNNWVRGTCQYGVLPCNGLVYAPPHACGCFMEAKLYGFWALAPAVKTRETRPAPLLEKGPAFGQVAGGTPPVPDDWPTYRHDPLRSGSTAEELPARLGRVWKADIGGRVSPPVVAAGTLIVSSIDAHQVVALTADDGSRRWCFTAGGRVDSPPGWVYCLRLGDGQLAWRFRAAPRERRTVALDQVESVWPVHGSILVLDGIAYAAAGRSSYLDGGIFIYALDAATGRVVASRRVQTEHPSPERPKLSEEKQAAMSKRFVQNATDYKTFTAPDHSDAFSMSGAITDVLVSDGESVFMRQLRFAAPRLEPQRQSRHLFSTSRLIDGAENHRSHWVIGTGDFSRLSVSYSWIANSSGRYNMRLDRKYGLMLAFDDEGVWGVRRTRDYAYKLFADENTPFDPGEEFRPDFTAMTPANAPSFKWLVDLAMRPRAIARAGRTVYLGGMPRPANGEELSVAYEGHKGGLLWAISAADGSRTAEYRLESPPVWDGLAVAAGRLYISTAAGQVLCMAGAE